MYVPRASRRPNWKLATSALRFIFKQRRVADDYNVDAAERKKDRRRRKAKIRREQSYRNTRRKNKERERIGRGEKFSTTKTSSDKSFGFTESVSLCDWKIETKEESCRRKAPKYLTKLLPSWDTKPRSGRRKHTRVLRNVGKSVL